MKRPIGVTVVAASAIVFGICSFAADLWIMRDFPSIQRFVFSQPKTWWALAQGIPLVMDITSIVAGIGLWRLRRWARRLVILLCLLGMMGLGFFFWKNFGTDLSGIEHCLRNPWPLLLPVALYGLCLGYMFTDEVKRAFSV